MTCWQKLGFNLVWLKQCHNYHPWLGMVTIPPIYGDDWGMVYYCFNHIRKKEISVMTCWQTFRFHQQKWMDFNNIGSDYIEMEINHENWDITRQKIWWSLKDEDHIKKSGLNQTPWRLNRQTYKKWRSNHQTKAPRVGDFARKKRDSASQGY